MSSPRKDARLTDATINEICSECREHLQKHRFSADEIDSYLERVLFVLDCYHDHLGENTPLEYRICKRSRRIELRLIFPGERVNPFSMLTAISALGSINDLTDLGFKIIGMPITAPFLLTLAILVLELSLANPGTTGGWTILFASLAFPNDFVGMFMTYKLACANYEGAYGAMQAGLEQIEAAYRFDAIDLEKLREKQTA